MTENLRKLGSELSALFSARARRFSLVSIFTKVALITLASAIVAIAQFAQVEDGKSFSTWQMAGIVGALVSCIGAIFVIITDMDASEELAKAQEVLDESRRFEEYENIFDDLVDQTERSLQLVHANTSMRGVVERVLSDGAADEKKAVETLLTSAARALTISFGFEQRDYWTLCIYKAELNSGTKQYQLRCIAHHRAIGCDLDKARIWPEGVGVAGMSYSNGREIVIPDMQAQELGSMFELSPAQIKDYDAERYRSIACVPVLLGRDNKPWGVVVATSGEDGHFFTDDRPGFRTREPLRSLAGMVALAVLAASGRSDPPKNKRPKK